MCIGEAAQGGRGVCSIVLDVTTVDRARRPGQTLLKPPDPKPCAEIDTTDRILPFPVKIMGRDVPSIGPYAHASRARGIDHLEPSSP